MCARDYLLAAPEGDDIRFDLLETINLAEAPADAAYSSDTRKAAQHYEALRRRGRLSREPRQPTETR